MCFCLLPVTGSNLNFVLLRERLRTVKIGHFVLFVIKRFLVNSLNSDNWIDTTDTDNYLELT